MSVMMPEALGRLVHAPSVEIKINDLHGAISTMVPSSQPTSPVAVFTSLLEQLAPLSS